MNYMIPSYIKKIKGIESFVLENVIDHSALEIENRYEQAYDVLGSCGTDNIECDLEKFLYDHNFLSQYDSITSFIENHLNILDRILRITIIVTEQCNFRCKYCYEEFQSDFISATKIGIICDFIESKILSGEIDQVQISWFGGEPLLASQIILDAEIKINKITEKYKVEKTSSISTNGYLLNSDLFKQLLDVGLNNFQITLDGFCHDKLRVLSDGSPTLDTILKNITAIHNLKASHHFTLCIRHNVLADDYDFEWYDFLKKLLKDDERFIFSIVPVVDLGNISHSLNLLPKNDSITDQHKAYIEKIGLRLVENNNFLNKWCYAKYKNGFVFRPKGKILKCTVLLSNEKNEIGQISSGKVCINEEINMLLSSKYAKPKCLLCKKFSSCSNIYCLKSQLDPNKECKFQRE